MSIRVEKRHGPGSLVFLASIMSRLAQKETEEADKLYREAMENTKTTLFRWKPDWEAAAAGFEQAARKYQKLGDVNLPNAIDAFKGASDAHVQLGRYGCACACWSPSVWFGFFNVCVCLCVQPGIPFAPLPSV